MSDDHECQEILVEPDDSPPNRQWVEPDSDDEG
jgi:hypothetical protein